MPGIYLHIPFCVTKCHYCDFYSEEILPVRKISSDYLSVSNIKSINLFVDYLIKEIELRSEQINYSDKITSIFFGGGTPSLLTSIHIDRILNLLAKKFSFASSPEITLESNPGTTTREKLFKYAASGVNRLSFGAQSFNAGELKFLQRIHNPEQIIQAVGNARLAGFSNINLDLMFSVPGQTGETLLQSLNSAIGLNPGHISAYSLIYEPGTPLYDDYIHGKVEKVNDDDDAGFYEITKSTLLNAGYIQYEVSNFAKKEELFCKHNLTYWQGDDYISFGPSAHGFFNGIRYWNHRSNLKYYECLDAGNLPVEGTEEISPKQKLTELIFLGLRATGIDLNDIKDKFNFDVYPSNKSMLDELIETGYILLSGSRLCLTSKGYSICDEIVLRIIEKIN